MSLFAIQVWAISQLVIIVLMILFFNMTLWFIKRAIKKSMKNKRTILNLLKEINENPDALTPEVIQFFNHCILELLLCMNKIDQKSSNNPNWERTKKLLSEPVLKKQSIRLARSKSWFKKLLTLLCYELGFPIDDEQTLLRFVKDDNLVISINAAIGLFRNPNPSAINEVITVFSKGRHNLRSTFASMLTNKPHENIPAIRAIFIKRLEKETDPYVRIFCYQILTLLEATDKIDSFVQNDLLNEHINLKSSALKYVAHVAQAQSLPILLKYLNDDNNEVRSTVVRLMGELCDESLLSYFNDSLKDPDWWVRINSAHGLLKLGTKGIAVLNAQSPKIDKFAYETAQACLKMYQNRVKE